MEIPVSQRDLRLRQDKAAAARLFLTGERISAFTTSPILALDSANGCFRQWLELGVQTKFGKRATTFLLPIPQMMETVSEWDEIVRTSLPHNYPWYARIEERRGQQIFSRELPGKNRRVPFEKSLHILCDLAFMPFKPSNKFRQGHTMFALTRAKTMADYMAILINLMHDSLTGIDEVHTKISENDVKTRIRGLANNPIFCPDNELREIIYQLSPRQLALAVMFIAARLSH